MTWIPISQAPKQSWVGLRSETILGIDEMGLIFKTFWSGDHPRKGSNGLPCWLMIHEDAEGNMIQLYEWTPTHFQFLPHRFRERREPTTDA